MLRRTWILFRARLAMTRRGGWAIPALVFHAVLGALLASLVRDVLPAFPFALLALSTGAAFLALALLSDLGTILRRDEAREWSATLPANAREHNLARSALLLVSLGALALALVGPFALLAPAGVTAAFRLALLGAALGLALCIAAVLLWIQWIAWTRMGGVLVLVQTLLLGAVSIGLLRTLGHLPEWARLGPGDPALRVVPPAWFAAAIVEPSLKRAVGLFGLVLGAGVALALLPPLATPAHRRTRGLLERGLRPLRALAARTWVRADERGAFGLVLDALPREREFALRTLPLFGIPLAFLWVGSSGAESGARADLLALLFFTIGVYLPVLLLNVPVSESPAASFLLRTAPVGRGAIDVGAVKALFVRYVLPLHVGLAVLALAFSAADVLIRLWPASLVSSLLVLQTAYPRCLKLQLPLSVAPEDLPGDQDWIGQTVGLSLTLTLAAVVLNRWATWPAGLLLAVVLITTSIVLERRLRRRPL